MEQTGQIALGFGTHEADLHLRLHDGAGRNLERQPVGLGDGEFDRDGHVGVAKAVVGFDRTQLNPRSKLRERAFGDAEFFEGLDLL